MLDDNPFATLEVEGEQTLRHTLRKLISPGEHKLQAVLVNKDGIESAPAEVSFNVDASRVYLFGFILPGYLVYSALLIVIVLFALLSIALVKRRRRKRMEKKKKPKDKKEEEEKEEKTSRGG